MQARTRTRPGGPLEQTGHTADVDALLHPAVIEAALKHDLPSDPWEEQAVAEHFGERAATATAQLSDEEQLAQQNAAAASRGKAMREARRNELHAGEGSNTNYDYGYGAPEGATPVTGKANEYLNARAAERAARSGQVADAYQYGQGYLNNPLDGKGRSRMGKQFWNAPLGGHIRGALEGQEVFGHTIDKGQAHMAEQGLAGLTAVGIGVPAFMAAVQQLTTPQDQNTIPF